MACGGRHGGLARHRHLYMRWKELFFIEGCESRLTIAGFYYLCLDRCARVGLGADGLRVCALSGREGHEIQLDSNAIPSDLRRVSGAIEGLYYDPSCAPDQHLMLQPTEKPAGFGFGFGDVERA